MEYKKRYLVNINSKNVHNTENSQKGCQIGRMKESNALFYDTLQEELEYPNKDNLKPVNVNFVLTIQLWRINLWMKKF